MDVVAADPSAAAFFDVDNTVLRGAAIFFLARGLYQRDFLNLRDIARFGWQQAYFLLVGENLDHVADIQDRALSFVAGHSVAELRAIGEEVFDELMADKIWPGTLELARMHEDAGQRVWLVTATPVEVADVISHRLGPHRRARHGGRARGRHLHRPAGRRTDARQGRRPPRWRRSPSAKGLDLSRCSAYSDSANDVPLLSLVGHPVAVNPDQKLRSHARANGWPVHDYRTGRKAAKIGVPVAAGAGLVAGAAVGAVAATRRYGRH